MFKWAETVKYQLFVSSFPIIVAGIGLKIVGFQFPNSKLSREINADSVEIWFNWN